MLFQSNFYQFVEFAMKGMRLRIRNTLFLLLCSLIFVWIFAKYDSMEASFEGLSIDKLQRRSGSRIEERIAIGSKQFNTADGNQTGLTGDDQRDEDRLYIGVLSTQSQGKWGHIIECPAVGVGVTVIQSVDYDLLGTTRALYIPRYSLGGIAWDTLQKSRSPNQLWIFNSFESPIHTARLSNKWSRFGFNWTFTYRTDSTFPSPYGRFIPGKPLVAENDTTNWAKGKTKFAAWIGSNCHNTGWPRMDFVNRLKKFMPLDTFGSCGTKSCPRNPKCGHTLIKYKFYFALENSNCRDYITEKFWGAPFNNNLIPVVYGPTREDYEKVAPPQSFIHVDDFNNMSDLADYLKMLDANDSLYNEYFQWKKKGSVETELIGNYYISRNVMCRIADRIQRIRDEGLTVSKPLDMKTLWTDSCSSNSPEMMGID